MSFFMTLSSNVDSLNTFGETNKLADFKTKLGRKVSLDGFWVVGLASITYTKSWFNITQPHKLSLIDELGGRHGPSETDEFTIQAGYYETANQLIQAINNILTKFTTFKPPKLVYNEINNYVTIKAGKFDENIKVFPKLSEEIESLLGLIDRNIYKNEYSNLTEQNIVTQYTFKSDEMFLNETHKAYHPVEITGGFHSLMVYSDIVYPTYVGDSFTALLRQVEVPRRSKFGETIHINYDKIYYMPILVNEFETIEIIIKDDSGLLIPFNFGRVSLTLHYKKL